MICAPIIRAPYSCMEWPASLTSVGSEQALMKFRRPGVAGGPTSGSSQPIAVKLSPVQSRG